MSVTALAVDLELIRRAEAFSMEPVLKRYARKNNVEVDAVRDLERELKRWLALCAMRPYGTESYGVRGEVDELWHTFILFTGLYADFCQSVAGRFLHHVPHELMTGDSTARYARTLRVYAEVFGESAPSHSWPQMDGAGASCEGSGLTQCDG
jgi:hypothetical protein